MLSLFVLVSNLFLSQTCTYASLSTICVWNATDEFDQLNGEYYLQSGKHNGETFWKRTSSASCGNPNSYIFAAYYDKKLYWFIYPSLTASYVQNNPNYPSCEDDTLPSDPTQCLGGYYSWPNRIMLTVSSGSCPQLSCNRIQVKGSGKGKCNKIFIRESTRANVYVNNGKGAKYLYFNSYTFKWYCSDTLGVDDCGNDETITHPYVSSASDGWYNVQIGESFDLMMSTSREATFKCLDTLTPTLSPTTNPTNIPSKTPSYYPTTTPSINPTSDPTDDPSYAPTQHPSFDPTTMPPSDQPSHSPTSDPTEYTTQYPFITPSPKPSAAPSKDPTNQPSYIPTNYPTQSLAAYPTVDPTMYPNDEPTVKPGHQYSDNPTLEPTNQPSNEIITTLFPTIVANEIHVTSDHLNSEMEPSNRWICNKECSQEINVLIDVYFSFSSQIMFDMNNMECFLHKLFSNYLKFNLDVCNIIIINVHGGDYNAKCTQSPCLYLRTTESNTRRLMTNTDGNTTMIIKSTNAAIYETINNLQVDLMEDDFENEFMNNFGVALNVQILSSLTASDQFSSNEYNLFWSPLQVILIVLLLMICCVCSLLAYVIYRDHKINGLKKKMHETIMETNNLKKSIDSSHDQLPKAPDKDKKREYQQSVELTQNPLHQLHVNIGNEIKMEDDENKEPSASETDIDSTHKSFPSIVPIANTRGLNIDEDDDVVSNYSLKKEQHHRYRRRFQFIGPH